MREQFETDALLRPYLFAGESLLWSGQPVQGIAFRAIDFLLIPFSLFWGGFVILWNITVWFIPTTDGGPGWFFRIWGLPFLVAGIYFIFGRFLHDALIRRRLVYGVSNERVILLRDAKASKIDSLEIRHLPSLQLSENADGTGTIDFDKSSVLSFFILSQWSALTPSAGSQIRFYRIREARRVYDIIRAQLRK
jgi:hypothetical protein